MPAFSLTLRANICVADGLFTEEPAGAEEEEPAAVAEEEEPAAGAEEVEPAAGAEEEVPAAGAEEEEAVEGSCRARQTKSCLICLALVRFLCSA